MSDIFRQIANELELKEFQVAKTIGLLFDEECTIPFVARYRKEMTGSLDEVSLRAIRDRYHLLTELDQLRRKYLKVVAEHCKTNPKYHGRYGELAQKFAAASTRQELDDLYLPFKPKRRTRAQAAREKGLERLCDTILERRQTLDDFREIATTFVNQDHDDPKFHVNSVEEALAGAADIFAERVNESAELRDIVRNVAKETACLVAEKNAKLEESKPADREPSTEKKKRVKKGKEPDIQKYQNYFSYKEPLAAAPSHRIMAVRRGEAEKVLRTAIEVDRERGLGDLRTAALGKDPATDSVKIWMTGAIDDAYNRLIAPSIENELRMEAKTRAEEEAIAVFCKNLERLLLLPPIPGHVVLGVDPGLRTGSKLAVVDDTGKPLATATIYPDYKKPASPKNEEARTTIAKLLNEHKVTCVAVGNGTGSREVDQFITATIKEKALQKVKRVVVNEAGASVYSTDEVAREEFPDLDATLRSAISIARRLQDPLAELVKINPRSIGVGQYQHDVNPTKLNKSLEEIVESCVNRVGVNINTASDKLLGYVSGVGPTLAKSIIKLRNSAGKFQSRADLQRVSGFGPKSFQQAVGFLRVPGSANPLDNSAVHPERYEIVEQIAKDTNQSIGAMIGQAAIVKSIAWEKYVSQTVGMPTLNDIAEELIKPGRDPREDGSRLLFSDDIATIEDLKIGMELPGTVSNVTNFGAFVDIGVHQDGLVHISELTDSFVDDPAKVVAVGDILKVRVIDVDSARKRISLSCKPQQPSAPRTREARSSRGPARNQTKGEGKSARPEGRGHRGSHQRGQRPRRSQRKPEKQHTLEDLMKKFGKD